MSPHGPGWLLYCNYLSDAKIFYCPSAQEATLLSDNQYGRLEQQTIKDWLKAGGIDSKTLTEGAWTEYNAGGGNSQYNILSQYHYRNTALHLDHYNSVAGNSTTPFTPAVEAVYQRTPLKIPYTAPQVTSTANCPAFKTQKILGHRSFMTDTWDKRGNYPAANGPKDQIPGFGFYTHRDGYNVLYGDYSASWFGDPQQRIIYWDMWDFGQAWSTYNDNTSGWYQCNAGLSYVSIMVGSAFDSRFKCMTGMESALTWNGFDQAAGIDVMNCSQVFVAP